MTEYQKNLVTTHIKLAQRLALEAWRRSPESMEKYEVVQVAYHGLLTAAVKFDPEWRPEDDSKYDPFLAFGSFARRRITGAIMDWQRARDHVPKRQRRIYKALIELGHGSGKTPEELSDLMGVPADKIRAVTQAVESTALSLDSSSENWAEPRYGAVPSSSASVEDLALASTIQSVVADTIQALPPLQRSVVVLRYYSGFDLTRVAVELQVSPSVVRAVHKEAVEEIHAAMRRVAS